jgi:hypothetical protein
VRKGIEMTNPFSVFCISDQEGFLLHYVQGTLFWNEPTNFDEVVDSTKFSSVVEAEEFIKERLYEFPIQFTVVEYKLLKV